MERTYNVKEITDFIIKEYDMVYDETVKGNYNIEVYRILKSEGIWEKGIDTLNGKKCPRRFTETQLRQLLGSEKMYNYVRERSKTLKDSPSYKDVMNEIASRRNRYIEYLDEQETQSEVIENQCFSDKEIIEKRNSIMIEAIFNVFFTEFNLGLFKHDLNTVYFSDELGLSPEILESEKRLASPENNYYSRRKE